MCSCDEDNQASAYRESERTARKAHRCYECGAAIAPGKRYVFISGIWDDGPDSFRWCVECASIRNLAAWCIEEDARGYGWFCFTFGSLLECVRETFRDEMAEARP